jgi:hypothetical protein
MSDHEIRVLEARVDELDRKCADLERELDDANYTIEKMTEDFGTIRDKSRKWA